MKVSPGEERPVLDPDRFFDFRSPGAQEWWYFDAISDDGRDVLVLVWYAALPFDPDYGVAALRHLDNPARFPSPNGLDHCAVGVSWHRDGKKAAYALNGFRERDFSHAADPFSVTIAGNRLSRDAEGYSMEVATLAVDGRTPVTARLRFRPASGTESLERDLGSAGSPHWWILAAADCRVEGELTFGGRTLEFRGRGYHDHNAGSEEISRAVRRWEWGRFHRGPLTEVFYLAEPHAGPARGLRISLEDGRPARVSEDVQWSGEGTTRNVFGVRSPRTLRMRVGEESLSRTPNVCLDDGPFYRRWLTEFTADGEGYEGASEGGIGISELLDTRNLNRRLFNWMIPYRLKRP